MYPCTRLNVNKKQKKTLFCLGVLLKRDHNHTKKNKEQNKNMCWGIHSQKGNLKIKQYKTVLLHQI